MAQRLPSTPPSQVKQPDTTETKEHPAPESALLLLGLNLDQFDQEPRHVKPRLGLNAPLTFLRFADLLQIDPLRMFVHLQRAGSDGFHRHNQIATALLAHTAIAFQRR